MLDEHLLSIILPFFTWTESLRSDSFSEPTKDSLNCGFSCCIYLHHTDDNLCHHAYYKRLTHTWRIRESFRWSFLWNFLSYLARLVLLLIQASNNWLARSIIVSVRDILTDSPTLWASQPAILWSDFHWLKQWLNVLVLNEPMHWMILSLNDSLTDWLSYSSCTPWNQSYKGHKEWLNQRSSSSLSDPLFHYKFHRTKTECFRDAEHETNTYSLP